MLRQAKEQVQREDDQIGVRNERPWGAWTLLETGTASVFDVEHARPLQRARGSDEFITRYKAIR